MKCILLILLLSLSHIALADDYVVIVDGGILLDAGESVIISAHDDGPLILSAEASDVDLETSGNVVQFVGQQSIVFAESAVVSTDHGLQLQQNAAAPTCDSSRQGTIYYTAGSTGVADSMNVCMKAADDSFSWRSVSF